MVLSDVYCPMLIAILIILMSPLVAAAAAVDFNRDVRPILSDKCFTCHGPDPAKRKTTLRFDMEASASSVIVVGDPEKSKLYQRISSDNKATRMPPAYAGHDKLAPKDIALIRDWIAQGAKWQSHWSLIAPVRTALPEAKRANWPRNPIDRFILMRLEKEGLSPSMPANRATLIRRVTLDLTGLPPTVDEVDAFVNDTSPSAYDELVDRLLASPRYAERMAFRWMEAARYADTNGYQSDGVRDMWRWRDWVIEAFQKNMPFDQFTIEQIAGDLLPNPTLDQRIATAFHRNHRTSAEGGIVPEEFRVEYVADRAETTASVWMGLTLGCARCHDHKYDPLLQKDFYRMFAFFNSVPEKGNVYNFGNEDPVIKAPTRDQQQSLQELDGKVAVIEQEYAALQPKLESAQRKWEQRPGIEDWTMTEGLVLRELLGGDASRFDGKRVVEVPGEKVNFNYQDPFTFAVWITPESSKGAILSHSEDYFEGQGHGLYLMDGKLRLHVIFRWTDLGLRVETENPVKLNERQHVVATYDGKRKASGVHLYINGREQKLKVLFDELIWPVSVKVPFRIGAAGGLRFQGSIEDVRVYKIALTPEQVAVLPLRKSIGEIAMTAPASRTKAESGKLAFCFLEKFAPKEITGTRARLLNARAEREKFYAAVPTLMVMADSETPRDTFVLKRGAYDNHGEKVTPGVPGVLPPMKPEWPKNRLGLARWLVDPSNPLTARVIVNRFWLMYFGTGLVKTVEDFGSQGESPVHPELLDWLAREFMDGGWNVKAMQKTIVMSATYQQSSKSTNEAIQRDPEDRLLSRGPRLRLGPEMIRDQALAVSGLLVNKVGGPSVKPYQPPGLWQELAGGTGYVADKGDGLYRRSLYTYWKRTIAPPFMVNFDSPSRETCTVRETRTNTPLQALNLMNDVAFLEAARKLAERMLLEGGSDPLGYGFKLALARDLKAEERQVLTDSLRSFQKRYKADHHAAEEFVSLGDSAQSSKSKAEKLAPYMAVASLIFNLDEMVTKE